MTDPAPLLLPVAALYESVQCEAAYAGTPSVFIRLQGCDVACPFCNVPETWKLNPARETSIGAMLAKEADTSSYAAIGVQTLLVLVRHYQARHVVITGGEPCRYDLTALTEALAASGYTAQIETSGTELVRADASAWITVAPKMNMPGGRSVLWQPLSRANEIKCPVSRALDIERFRALLITAQENPGWVVPDVWLQPLNGSPKATALCLSACLEHGWKLCVPSAPVGVR